MSRKFAAIMRALESPILKWRITLSRRFNFDLYRLNVVDFEDLFLEDADQSRIRSDNEIKRVLEASCEAKRDQPQETRSAEFLWSVREFNCYPVINSRSLCSLILARSTISKDGLIVTEEGISAGKSSATPPLASAAMVFFDLTRHLVAVEHTGELSQTAWKDFFERIISETALSLGLTSFFELEPVPEKHGIIGLFKSFDKITRIKMTLRIPNPELTRYTKSLYDDLAKSGIREYTQDMKSPNGLSKSEDARPYASAYLAEQGYKKGDVQFTGIRNDVEETIRSGSASARGSVKQLRDFVRGMHTTAKTKEAQAALSSIIEEIDKLHPKGDVNE